MIRALAKLSVFIVCALDCLIRDWIGLPGCWFGAQAPCRVGFRRMHPRQAYHMLALTEILRPRLGLLLPRIILAHP
jgi:hypothetical protein